MSCFPSSLGRGSANLLPWVLTFSGLVLSCRSNSDVQQAASDKQVEQAVIAARNSGNVPANEPPPATAIAVLSAYYHQRSGQWLDTMPACDLISAISWTRHITVPKDRLIELRQLAVSPGTHDYLHVPETSLSTLIISALQDRELTLEEFRLFSTWIVDQWTGSDEEDDSAIADAYPVNAIIRENGKVEMPTVYTWSSLHHLRDQDQPPLAIARLGSQAAAMVPSLLRAAKTEKHQFDAITMLALMAPTVDDASRGLIELLRTENTVFVPTAIVTHLGNRAVPGLAALLEDSKPTVRKRTMEVLEELGTQARGCQTQVLTVLKNDDETDVVWAALNVLALNPPSPQATLGHVEDLVRASRLTISRFSGGKETNPQGLVADILSAAGPEVIPRVTSLLENEDREVRWWAATMLRRLVGNESAVSTFVRLLDHADLDVQWTAMAHLNAIGHQAQAAIPALRKKIADRHYKYREEARHALEAIQATQPASKPAAT